MRLLFIFACIAGLIWYGIHTFGSKDNQLLGSGLGAVTKFGASAMAPVAGVKPASGSSLLVDREPVPADLPAADFKPALGTDAFDGEKAKAFQSYRFQHREPPTGPEITVAAAVGAQVTVDKLSGIVGVSGPLQGVGIVMRYLEAVDVVPGSCGVQSWAVFVDRSVSKGFDLLAAISAVGGGTIQGDIGGGGLTLDIPFDRLSVALNAICDGSVVEVVQRPHVILQHGIASHVESIQEVPIPSTAVSNGIAQTSIEYRKVGLQLDVTPYFLKGDRLRLAVAQSNGLIGQSVKIGESEVPVIQSQSVSSSLEMSVGQTVVLGGVTTYRQRVAKGLLHNSTTIAEGSLYVVISTFSEVPRAIPVSEPVEGAPGELPPLIPRPGDPGDWISGELLPPLRDSSIEERKFIKSRSGK